MKIRINNNQEASRTKASLGTWSFEFEWELWHELFHVLSTEDNIMAVFSSVLDRLYLLLWFAPCSFINLQWCLCFSVVDDRLYSQNRSSFIIACDRSLPPEHQQMFIW